MVTATALLTCSEAVYGDLREPRRLCEGEYSLADLVRRCAVCAIAEAGLSLNCTHTTQTATSPRRGHRPEPSSRERLPEDSCAGMLRKNGIQWVRVCTFGSALLPLLKRSARAGAELTEATNRVSQRLARAVEKERSQFVVAAPNEGKTSRKP